MTDGCIDRLRNWRIEHADATVDIMLEELRVLQATSGLKVRDRVVIFLGAVFTEACVTSNEIILQKEALSKMGSSALLQRHLISGFEWFCGTRFPSLGKHFPVVLKILYDEDLIEEEIFMEWYDSSTRTDHSADSSMITFEVLEQLRLNAAPFITWLKEAEEEDDEEEEDDA